MERFEGEHLSSSAVNLDWIRQLVALVEQEDLSELIISQGEVTIIIRGRSYRPNVLLVGSSAPVNQTTISETQTETFETEGHSSTIPDERLFHITSPLRGVFYSRPRPDAPPFVTVRSEVEPEQVVALVEAMKFFNEVKSEVHGIVREILVKDGQLVKHGDTLFVLERLD